jgi:hypothetical protein
LAGWSDTAVDGGRNGQFADGYTLSHVSWKSIPDSRFEFSIAAFDRPCGLQSTSSVQPELRPIVFAQIGRLAKKIESAVRSSPRLFEFSMPGIQAATGSLESD